MQAVSDGMYTAINMPLKDRQARHEKHWRYVASHTVSFWAQSFFKDLKASSLLSESLLVIGGGVIARGGNRVGKARLLKPQHLKRGFLAHGFYFPTSSPCLSRS